MDVKLTRAEMFEAAIAGIMRHIENLGVRQDYHDIPAEFSWQADIEGAIGERALAKALGIYWAGRGQFRGSDVGRYEVRTTRHATGRLILHPADADEAIFWLVTGADGTYQVRGWIKGCDGKRQEYWADPKGGRAAYFVPQSALHREEIE